MQPDVGNVQYCPRSLGPGQCYYILTKTYDYEKRLFFLDIRGCSRSRMESLCYAPEQTGAHTYVRYYVCTEGQCVYGRVPATVHGHEIEGALTAMRHNNLTATYHVSALSFRLKYE